MRARKLLEGSSFAPDTLKAVGQAFDEAWTEIAGNFTGAAEIEAARLKLASILLSAASDHRHDVAGLKRAGLEALAKAYRI